MKKQFPAVSGVLFLSVFLTFCFFSVAQADETKSQNTLFSSIRFPALPTVPELPSLIPAFSQIVDILHEPAAQTGTVFIATASDFSQHVIKPVSRFPTQTVIVVSAPLRSITRTASALSQNISHQAAVGTSGVAGGWWNTTVEKIKNLFSSSNEETLIERSNSSNKAGVATSTTIYIKIPAASAGTDLAALPSSQAAAFPERVIVAGTNTSLLLRSISALGARIDALEGRPSTIINNNYVSQQTDSIGDSISRLITANNTNIINNITNVSAGGGSTYDESNVAITGGTITGVNATTTDLEVSGTLSFDGLYGSAGQVLVSQGTSTTPVWQSLSSSATNTDQLSEGLTNLYFTDARARNALSATGALSFATSTGIISVTSGYNIPLTASTTEWASKVSSQWTNSGSNIYFSSGNVGIGTSSPGTRLEIMGNASSSIRIGASTLTNYAAIQLNNSAFASGNNNFYSGASNDLYINRPTGAQIRFREGNSNDQLTLAASGNVGVGTTTPGSLLEVNGSLNFNSLKNVRLVFEGDSLTSSPTIGWPLSVPIYHSFLGKTTSTNYAVGSDTAANMVSEYATEGALSAPYKNADEAYFFLWAGTNDVYASTPAATIYDYLKSIWASARADGYRVVAFTVMPRGSFDAPREAIRTSLNEMILSDPSLYDYVVRPDKFFTNPSDTTYFNADAVHLNAAGYVELAKHVNLAMSRAPGMFVAGTATTSSTGLDFIFNPAGNYIGIGTTTPSHKLTVGGDINFTGSLYQNGSPFTSGNSAFTIGNGFIYNATSTNLVGIGSTTPISTLSVKGKGGVNPFTVSSSTDSVLFNITQAGNVGIGVSNPTFGKLQIVQAGAISPSLYVANSDNSGNDLAQFWAQNLSVGVGINYNGIRQVVSGQPLFVDAGTNATLLLNGNSTGNVGIGTTNPSAGSDLSVAGGGVSIGGTYYSSSAPTSGLIVEGSVGIGTTTPGRTLTVAGTSHFTATSTYLGRIMIGTSTMVSNIAGISLAVDKDIAFRDQQGIRWFNDANGAAMAGIWYDIAHPNELHIDSSKSIYLGPGDGTVTDFTVQLGPAGGAGGGAHTYLPRDSTASGSNLTAKSQYLLFNTSRWNTDHAEYGGADLWADTDTSDNVTFKITPDNRGGNITNDISMMVYGPITGRYFTATSTAAASTFPYASTTALTVGSNAYFPSGKWNSSGELGVGTTTTSGYKLAVGGSINFTGDLYQNGELVTVGGGGGSGTVTSGTGGQFAYYASNGTTVSGTSTLFLSSGNIGIGTTSPLSKLDVYGDAILSGGSRYLNFGGTAGTSGYGFRDNAGTMEYKNSGGSWSVIGTGGTIGSGTAGQLPYYAGSGTSLTATSNIFISSGSVGIGTTTPLSALDVNGDIRISSSTRQFLAVGEKSSATPAYAFAGNTTSGMTFSGSHLRFSAIGTEVLSFRDAGYVSIGDTTALYPLSVKYSGDTYIKVQNKSAYYGGKAGILIGESGGADNYIKSGIIYDAYDSTGGGYGRGKLRFAVNGILDNSNVQDQLESSTMMVLDYQGYAGIGSSSPSARLAVSGSSSLPVADIFVVSSSSNAHFLTVKSSGNVGIGSSSPFAKLSVAGDFALTGGIYDKNETMGTLGQVLQTTGTGVQWVATSTLGLGGVGGSGTVESGTAGFFGYYPASNTTIDDQGVLYTDGTNIGVGTTTPGSKFTVNGNIDIGTTSISTAGLLTQNGTRLLHTFGTTSLYLGKSSGNFSATGSNNIGVGQSVLSALTSGNDNVGIGFESLQSLTSGERNVVVGKQAARFTDSGADNVAIGNLAMYLNTSGAGNVALGTNALSTNSTGGGNISMGTRSNWQSTSASHNISLGFETMYYNLDGPNNIAIGFSALQNNRHGANSIAIGYNALLNASSTGSNVALGTGAGAAVTSGTANVFLGTSAGANITTGSSNLMLGYNINAASTTGSYQLNIGNFLFGTGMDGTGSTISNGTIGIGSTTPISTFAVKGRAGLNPLIVSSSTDSILFSVSQGGNVGVGTTTNSAKFIVLGTGLSTDFHIGRTVNSNYFFATAPIGTPAASNLGINGNNILSLVRSGTSNFVGIGTTTASSTLDVYGTSGPYDVFAVSSSSLARLFTVTGAGSVGIGVSAPSAQLHTTGSVRFANFGAGSLTTDANGNVSVVSDESMKDIDGDFTRGLEDIKKINPISYHWKIETGYDTEHLYTGFSAQNVQGAIPEAVLANPQGLLSLQDRPILAAAINALKELGSVFDKIENGIAYMKDVVVEKLTIGSSSKPAGITIFDQATGNPFCIKVVNGVMMNVPGTCDTAGVVVSSGGTPSVTPTPEPDPGPVPEPTPTPVDDAATTTDDNVTDLGSGNGDTPEGAEPVAATVESGPEVSTPTTEPAAPSETSSANTESADAGSAI